MAGGAQGCGWWSCMKSLEQQQHNSKLELEEGWVPSICLCISLLLTGSNPHAQYHLGWSKCVCVNPTCIAIS